VALVCEAEFGGEACDVGLSVGEAVEGGSHAQPDAMAGDGVSGDRMENAAEVVVWGDAERARQVREGTKWVGASASRAVREHASSASRGRPAGGDATWIQLLERAGSELDSTLEELVGVGAARFGEETAMLEIDPPRRGKRARWQGRVVSAGDIGHREPVATQDGARVQHPPERTARTDVQDCSPLGSAALPGS
jgi:hypothetical protein